MIRDYRSNGMSPGGAKAMVNYYRANFANPARLQALAVTKEADRADADDLG